MSKRTEGLVEIDGKTRKLQFDGFPNANTMHYRNAIELSIDNGDGRPILTVERPSDSGRQRVISSKLTLEECIALSRMFRDAAEQSLKAQMGSS